MKKFLKNRKGVSPIISTTLIFAILMTGVIFIYSWGLPLVLNFQDKSEVNDVVNQFYELDRNVKIVMHEGDGATRSTQFELKKGLLNHTSSSDFNLILVSGSPPDLANPDVTINVNDLGRMAYVIRSSMDDLPINSNSTLTGAVDAYPILNVTQSAADAGIFPAFNEDEQNKDITRIVYTRPEYSRYSVFLEYRPILKITAQESSGRVSRVDLWLYLIELDNVGSFPKVGATEIIVKRVTRVETDSSASPTIQDRDHVYLYALVDGIYQQLTLEFEAAGSLSLYQHTVITQIQIYDV